MTVHDASKQLASRYLKMLGFNKDQHLRNMCLTIIEHVDEWPIDKSSRWLGFIQAGVINHKLTTIEKERNFSRPLFHEAYKLTEQSIPQTIDLFEGDSFEDHF